MPQLRVKGFDPDLAVTRVLDIDEETGDLEEISFMRFSATQAWFLTVYPDGCMNHVFNVLNDRKATVTASVYRRPSDQRPAATATCTRYYADTDMGRNYEQNAVTAAYRKALGYMGFRAPEREGGEERAVSERILSSEEERSMKIPRIPIPGTEQKTTGNEENETRPDVALSTLFTRGKYKGESIGRVALKDPRYISYMAARPAGTADSDAVSAAGEYLRSRAAQR